MKSLKSRCFPPGQRGKQSETCLLLPLLIFFHYSARSLDISSSPYWGLLAAECLIYWQNYGGKGFQRRRNSGRRKQLVIMETTSKRYLRLAEQIQVGKFFMWLGLGEFPMDYNLLRKSSGPSFLL